MEILFFLSLIFVLYAYFGYAAVLWVKASLQKRPILQFDVDLSVTIIIAAHNEEQHILEKLQNLRRLDYHSEKIQIIIVSDGSTDKTSDILNEHASYLFPIILDRQHGKAHALNTAVKHATGEILVFQDARQSIDSRALVELISCFADPDVGAVSGDLILEDNRDQLPSNALGVYWKIEKIIRKLESESGSVVGVTGALYAIRRDLYTEMPPATILDDVFIPMHVVRMGKRVIFQPTAIVRDKISSEKGREFSRKVRTLTGNYQLLQLAPWILTSKNPLCFQFYSHKIIRLLVPLFLFCMLITSIESSSRLLRGVFWIQILFYILAIVGELHISFRKYKIVIIPNTFVMLNIAAICAFRNYVTNRYDVWK